MDEYSGCKHTVVSDAQYISVIITHMTRSVCYVRAPAVDDHRAGVGWRGRLDSADEGQQSCSVVWYAMLRPCCKVELLDLVFC